MCLVFKQFIQHRYGQSTFAFSNIISGVTASFSTDFEFQEASLSTGYYYCSNLFNDRNCMLFALYLVFFSAT